MYLCCISVTVREPRQKSSVGGTDSAENHVQNPGQGHEEHGDLDRLAVLAGRCHTAEKGTQSPSIFIILSEIRAYRSIVIVHLTGGLNVESFLVSACFSRYLTF